MRPARRRPRPTRASPQHPAHPAHPARRPFRPLHQLRSALRPCCAAWNDPALPGLLVLSSTLRWRLLSTPRPSTSTSCRRRPLRSRSRSLRCPRLLSKRRRSPTHSPCSTSPRTGIRSTAPSGPKISTRTEASPLRPKSCGALRMISLRWIRFLPNSSKSRTGTRSMAPAYNCSPTSSCIISIRSLNLGGFFLCTVCFCVRRLSQRMRMIVNLYLFFTYMCEMPICTEMKSKCFLLIFDVDVFKLQAEIRV